MKRRIAVDSRILQSNHQNGDYRPPIELIDDEGSAHFYRVDIFGANGEVAASVVYRPTKERAFDCWIETENVVLGHSEPSAMLTGETSSR